MTIFAWSKIEESLHYVFPGKCYNEILFKYNIFDQHCTSLVISRVLGLGITIGSLILFIPQIIKIQLAGSAEGVSLASQLLGFTACFVTAAYSFSSDFVFSQWGDTFFVAIQMIIIVFQILWFASQRAYAAVFIAVCWTSTCALIGGYIPNSVLYILQAGTIPIMIVAKFLQAKKTYDEKSTGQLSLISVALQLGGCVARVFTSVRETGDQLIILTYLLASIMNGIIFFQFFLYWTSPKKKKTA